MNNKQEPYKLYLDDLREPQTPGWIIVRTYEAFIATIKEKGTPTEISFDHDLGWDEEKNEERKSGYDCAQWIVENEIPLEAFNVHSANPVGAGNIIAVLTKYCRDNKLKFFIANLKNITYF